MENILQQLEKRRKDARLGGGEKRVEAQHEKGKLTARERLEVLLDRNSFEEFDMFVTHNCTDFGMETQKIPGDGVGSYRRYYILEKRRFATWKSPAKIPEWYTEGVKAYA